MRSYCRILLLLICPLAVLAAEVDSVRAKLAARYTGWRDACFVLDLTVQRPDGGTREGRAELCQLVDGADRYARVQVLAPLGARGIQFISQRGADGRSRQWMYTPASKRAVAVQDGGAERPFLGTDFSSADLELYQADPARAKPVADESCGDTHCRIYELPPSQPRTATRRIWVVRDSGAIHRVDVLSGTKPIKRLDIVSELRGPEGYWLPVQATMRDLRSSSLTVVTWSQARFNRGLKRAEFDAEARWGTGVSRPAR
ncbi:MAG: outer membrane lipoprotein-sorting protein [Nevskiales bacterium]